MVVRGRMCRGLGFGLLIALAALPASASSPVGVSPGAAGRVPEVEGRFPTFIWGAVSRAAGYELVVYRLPDEPLSRDGGALELSASDEVLFAELPAGATAWQPELADGLDPGADYVWFVRAVTDAETGEGSEWSEPRFFEVAAAPSAEQVRQAMDLLERWQAANDSGSLVLPSAAATDPVSVPAAAAAVAADSGSGAGVSGKSVPTAVAAVRGSSPDPTGEAYGVVGLSASADSAGLAAANTGGGPDLVLDGSEDLEVDAELSQSGIDRPSGTLQTFDITNSTGAGMTLRVDGVAVLTTASDLDAGNLTSGTVPDGRFVGTYSEALALTNPGNAFTGSGAGLTGVDADTLDGVDGAVYATDAEAAAMVAAHAASSDHDGRYSTETELATSGASAVHWGNLTAVPAGFADGIDNEASFTAGPGIIVDGDEIRIDPGAFSTRVATLDSARDVGWDTSIAIGADGLGLISYYDATNDDLKVAHCSNAACSSAATATIDSADYFGYNTAIAIGADGLGLISYYDWTNGDLKVARCHNTACSSATTATIDSAGLVGSSSSIAIGADGLGLISYRDGTIGLKAAHLGIGVP